MMAILLTILKVIGIGLLCILALLIVILALVLWVPLRYRLEVLKYDRKENAIEADIKLSWLLHLIGVRFQYPEAAYVRVTLFGLTIFRSDKPRKSKKHKNTEQKKEETDKTEETNKTEETAAEQKTAEHKADAGKEDPPCSENIGNAGQDEAAMPQNKMQVFFQAVLRRLKNLKYTIRKIYDKIVDVIRNIRFYLEVLKSELFQNTWKRCSTEAIRLLKSIAPRKIKGRIRIGMEDPAATGQILAYYGMLYPFLGDKVDLIPEFERVVLEGNLLIKGKITAFRVLKTAFVIYFNQDLRKLLKLLKREDE